jgi:tungstate transport system substrate-binding protein
LHDDIKDSFQNAYPWITINFDPLGTGLAIAKAESGTDDMLLVHSPSQELPVLSGGYGVDRKIIAYNYFIIVGPPSDPAHIAQDVNNVTKALLDIYNAAQNNSLNGPSQQVLWFSRNDASGTNTKEISLWNGALAGTGVTYNQLNNTALNGSWFKDTNTGMGPTLLATDYYGAVGGYTISDTGTYYAYYDRGDINLQILVAPQQSLLNVYSAIIDNPQNAALANTKFDASLTFVNWLVSNAGQQVIANYGKASYNQQLFNPFVPLANAPSSNSTLWGWITNYAYMYFNTTSNKLVISNATGSSECPSQYQYNAGSLTFYTMTMAMSPNLSNNYVAEVQKPLDSSPPKTVFI